MKCQTCGAELANDAKFCRECGAKAVLQKRFCRECGAKLLEGDKFCSECGAKVDFKSDASVSEISEKTDSTINDLVNVDHVIQGEYTYIPQDIGKKKPVSSKIKLMKNIANNSDDYQEKITEKVSKHKDTVYGAHMGSMTGRGRLHGEKLKKEKSSNLFFLLGALIVIFIIFIALLLGNKSPKDRTPIQTADNNNVQTETKKPVGEKDFTIEKGSQYAFMSDEWNVYIAEAISADLIKIEHWHKSMSTTKKMSFYSDIGSYRINDSENGFSWVDDEHTAFNFIFKDKDTNSVKKESSHVFTINISDSDISKGTDYDKDIACYKYVYDDWHMYRAIPLNDSMIKIECWYRGVSVGQHLFGWDWCVVDPENNDMKFEWTDDEHTSFTMITKDPQNRSYWETDEFVVFELENPEFEYANVRDYLDGNKVNKEEKTDEKVEPIPEETEKLDETEVVVKETEALKKEDPKIEEKETEALKKEDPKIEEKETEASKKEEPKVVTYSTNTEDTVKNGDSGVYAYKKSGSYDLYYIIDFDEGYVYWFSEGNGEESCDRLMIESGNLNDVLIITYHDSGDEWSYGLHFKYKNQPDHMILEDNNHFEHDYYSTNLKEALKLRDKKKIHDY